MGAYNFLRFPDFKDKALTLSYDDGQIHDRRLVEILNRGGLKCTFNLNSGWLDDGHIQPNEFKSLYLDSGHEIAVHGLCHQPYVGLQRNLVTSDIMEDRKNLEKYTGKIIRGAAYPYGMYDDSTVESLRACGISYCRTIHATGSFAIPTDWLRLPVTCHHNDPILDFADKFLEPPLNGAFWFNNPKLFFLWGHSFEFSNNDNWHIIEDFVSKIGNRDDIWYATNIEIYDYVKAYDRLEFSVDATSVYNPSAIDVYIDYNYHKVVCKAGKVTEIK